MTIRTALAGALALVLGGCGGAATVTLADRVGGDSENRGDATGTAPARILQTKKFAIDQPVVLRQIGVHHAYAKG